MQKERGKGCFVKHKSNKVAKNNVVKREQVRISSVKLKREVFVMKIDSVLMKRADPDPTFCLRIKFKKDVKKF